MIDENPSWGRRDAVLDKIFMKRPEQRWLPRVWIMQNIDSVIAVTVVLHYNTLLGQYLVCAWAHQHTGLPWDVRRALQEAANNLDWDFANALDSHVDSIAKRLVGGNGIFKRLFEAGRRELVSYGWHYNRSGEKERAPMRSEILADLWRQLSLDAELRLVA